MSLQDLKGGTFSTKELIESIVSELDDLLNPEQDKEAGRLGVAQRKTWLNQAIREYVRLHTNPKPDFRDPPDDTVRESER